MRLKVNLRAMRARFTTESGAEIIESGSFPIEALKIESVYSDGEVSRAFRFQIGLPPLSTLPGALLRVRSLKVEVGGETFPFPMRPQNVIPQPGALILSLSLGEET